MKSLFTSKEHYRSFITAWKIYCSTNGKSLSSKHFVLYAALKGKDWRKGFTPCTNPHKLQHGAQPYLGAATAVQAIDFGIRYNVAELLTPFGDTVTKEMIMELHKYLPELKEFRTIRSTIYDKLPDSPYKEVASVLV